MNHIRQCLLAMLALVAGVLTAVPAQANDMGGAMSGAAGGSNAAANASSNAAAAAAGAARERITPKQKKDKADAAFELNKQKARDQGISDDDLRKRIDAAIDKKYDVQEPDHVKILTPEELAALRAKLADDEEQKRKDFAALQAEQEKARAAQAAAVAARWKKQDDENKKAALAKQAADEAAEAERAKNPNYIDAKGFNKTDNPNPLEEANRNRTLPGVNQGDK